MGGGVDTRREPCYHIWVLNGLPMQDEYLTRCVVDPLKKKVYIYSNEGSEKEVSCDTSEEFMNVLSFIRETLDDSLLSYVNPL